MDPLVEAQKLLLHCFSSIQTGVGDQVNAAEAKLMELEAQPGYGLVLVALMANSQVAPEYRQFAAIRLRRFIADGWFDQPKPKKKQRTRFVAISDRDPIRNGLLQLFGDRDFRIRREAADMVAIIGKRDYPEKWPGLLEQLVQAVNGDNAPLVDTALRSLAGMSSGMDLEKLTQIVPALFPALLRVVASPQAFSVRSRAKAIRIFEVCAASIQSVCGTEDIHGVLKQLLLPTLADWMKAFCIVLDGAELSAPRYHDYGLPLAVLKALMHLISQLPGFVAPHIDGVVVRLWQTLSALYPKFDASLINTEDADDPAYNTEGDQVDLPAFLSQALEFVIGIAESPLRPSLAPLIGEMPYALLAYSQMTTPDLDRWKHDANEYVAEEEEHLVHMSTVRATAIDTLMSLLEYYREQSIAAVAAGALKRLQESNENRSAGVGSWWKLQETAIYALGLVCDNMTQPYNTSEFDFDGYASGVLASCLDPSHASAVPEYVRARALWAVSHVGPILVSVDGVDPALLPRRHALARSLFEALARAVAPTEALIVRLQATRTFGMLNTLVPAEFVAPLVPPCLPFVAEQLRHAQGEVLIMSMETIIAILEAHAAVVPKVEAALSQITLDVWAAHGNDGHEVLEAVKEMIRVLADNAETVVAVQQRFMPAICHILTGGAKVLPGVMDTAVEAFASLVRFSAKHKQIPTPSVFQQALPLLCDLLMHTEAADIILGGTDVLALMVKNYTPQIVQIKHPISQVPVLTQIMQFTARLLDPAFKLEDSRSIVTSQAIAHIGSLVCQLVFQCAGVIGEQNVLQLMRASVLLLASSEYPSLTEHLLVFFARLLHTRDSAFLDFLQQLGSLNIVRNKQTENVPALQFVLSKWIEAQKDVHTQYYIKVTLTALAKFLQIRDPRISSIAVQGYPIVDPNAAAPRSTRSRPAVVQYGPIPLPVAVVRALLRAWAEQLDRVPDDRPQAEDAQSEDSDADPAERDMLHQYLKQTGNVPSRNGAGGNPGGSTFAPAPAGFGDSDHEIDGDDDEYMDLDEILQQAIDLQGANGDADAQDDLHDPEKDSDPICSIDIRVFVQQLFSAFAAQDATTLQQLASFLSPADQQVLREVLALSQHEMAKQSGTAVTQ